MRQLYAYVADESTHWKSVNIKNLLWYLEKIWEICCSDEKEEVSPCKQFKIQRQIQHYPIGVGLLPTHHDKNNERSSEIPPLGLYI